MDIQEKACWLALLSDADVDRNIAKRALYRWTIVAQQPLSACAPFSAQTLMEQLPELDALQAERWQAAFGRASQAQEIWTIGSHKGSTCSRAQTRITPRAWQRGCQSAGCPTCSFIGAISICWSGLPCLSRDQATLQGWRTRRSQRSQETWHRCQSHIAGPTLRASSASCWTPRRPNTRPQF